jgi:hypothetical protein
VNWHLSEIPSRAGARGLTTDHLVVDASGIPLAVTLTGGNRYDVTQVIPLLDALGGPTDRRQDRPPRPKPDLASS